jgi:hypothetical protein
MLRIKIKIKKKKYWKAKLFKVLGAIKANRIAKIG